VYWGNQYIFTLDLTKFLTCSLDLNIVTISGTTHMKMIFSFLPGTGKHFIGNTLQPIFMHIIHILHFFMINNVSYKPSEKIQRSQSQKMRV
jgi:hypothetical protein